MVTRTDSTHRPLQTPRPAAPMEIPDVRKTQHEADVSWTLPRLGKLAGLVLLGLVVVIALVRWLGGGESESELVFHTASRGNLDVVIVERGNLASQETVDITCQVEDVEGDGLEGTPILWIVPNGATVEEGDLLVELDAAMHKERVDQQILDHERARLEQVQATLQYENQITQNETALASAELDVELAQLGLQMFEDESGGTFQIDVQEVDMQIREAQSRRLINHSDLLAVEQLYKRGYRSKGDLSAARLSSLSADQDLARLTALRRKKVEYEYQMSRLDLTGKVETAGRNLEQVKRDNDASLSQMLAKKESADRAFAKETERLERYHSQFENCKVYAPRGGMVAYAVNAGGRRGVVIEEGAVIRERQRMLTIPDLVRMQVKTSVHESVVDQVRAGLSATVRLDAYPHVTYRGTVKSVSVLPDPSGWESSDTKVYPTIVTIDDDLQGMKPGMTAVVEIHVDRLNDIIKVPVQSVVQIGGDNWSYVDVDGTIERRLLKLGRTSDQFVEIREGIEAGERVVVNPSKLVDGATEQVTIGPAEGGARSADTTAAH